MSLFSAAFRKRLDEDTELGQAIVRFPVGMVCALYLFLSASFGLVDVSRFEVLHFASTACFFVAATINLLLVLKHPGVYPARRVFAMVLDFLAVGIILSTGGEPMLPIFGGMIWVTVGYGIRFGKSYLLLSTSMALVTTAAVIFISPHWQTHYYQTAALMIILIICPGYTMALIARLQAAHERAHDANLRKSRFVAQVSHDLRQPIHAISLLTARMADIEISDQQADLVAKIDRSVQGAIQLMQTFLNVTSIEAGQVNPQLEPVHLGRLLGEQASQFAALAEANGGAVHAAKSNCVVMTDRIFITTIIQNLLSNAIKHAPGSDVLIGCRHVNGQRAICVYDRGPGLEETDLPALGNFSTGQSPHLRPLGGYGLGLSIVSQLANSLDLELQIRSEIGKGSAFWVSGLTPASLEEALQTGNTTPLSSHLSGLGVVLIEDDPTTLEATHALLVRWGCSVTCHLHPKDACFDHGIIVSDYEFADGTTLADRPAFWTTSSPLIIVTGHPREEVSRKTKDRFITLLEKPLRAAELRSALLSAKLAGRDIATP